MSAFQKLFGADELSERDVKHQIIRSCVGISMAVCVVYGAYSIPKGSLQELSNTAEESPRLVILGREEEETITTIMESIQQEDGSVLSLENFLNTMICGACSRRCPLVAPRCRRGMSKAETQSAYYAEAVKMIESGDSLQGLLCFDDPQLSC